MQDITFILEAVLTVLGILLIRYAVPAVKKWLAERELAELDYWLNLAVYAAEERYWEKSGQGQLKFQAVKGFLTAKGYDFDEDTLRVLIDGMVKQTVHAFRGSS